MRSHGNSELSAPVRDAHLRQRVLNTQWPRQDKDGPHARGIQDKPAGEQIEVTVRLVLERDGEVHLPGKAITWHGRCVLVLVSDDRIRPGVVWVDASDVRRR